MNLQTFSMLSRSKILYADSAFFSILSIILRVVHRKLKPVISMLYAMHECPRTHASMHCSSENTSSLEFTRPIRIALNVMSKIWGGEHGTSTRAVKVVWITMRKNNTLARDFVSFVLQRRNGKLKTPVCKTVDGGSLARYQKFWVVRLAKTSLSLVPMLYPRKKAATIWDLEKFSVLNSFPDLPFRPKIDMIEHERERSISGN